MAIKLSELLPTPSSARKLSSYTGESPEPSVAGFLTDSRSWQEMAARLAGTGAQLSDMATGAVGVVAGLPAYWGVNTQALLQGESPQIAAEAAQAASDDVLPEQITRPYSVLARELGPDAERFYHDNPIGWISEKVSEILEDGGKSLSARTGMSAGNLVTIANQGLSLLGVRAGRNSLQRSVAARRAARETPAPEPFASEPVAPETPIAPELSTLERVAPAEELYPQVTKTVRAQGRKNAQIAFRDLVKEEPLPAKEGLFDFVDKAQRGAASPKLLAAIAAAGGVAAFAAANPEYVKELTGLGLLAAGAGTIKSVRPLLASTEGELISASRTGSNEAFAELYRRTEPDLRRGLNSYAKSGVDVSDVVQSAYISAFDALKRAPDEAGGFRGDSKFSTFLYTVAHNKAKNAVEAQKARPETVSLDEPVGESTTIADTLGHTETPLKSLETSVLQERISAAMDKLDPAFREAFDLSEMQKIPYAEIAEIQGVPIGTVRSRIFRAKAHLQKSLKDYQGGYVSPKLLVGAAAVGTGAAIGAASSDSPVKGGLYGALAGALVGTGTGRQLLKEGVKSPAYVGTVLSTNLAKIKPALAFRARRFEKEELQALAHADRQIHPFAKAVKALPPAQREAVEGHLLDRDYAAVMRYPGMKDTVPAVRNFLERTQNDLVELKRFKTGLTNYFPRRIKDFEGLKAALGQEVTQGLEGMLAKAERAMQAGKHRALTDLERDVLVQRFLTQPHIRSSLPNFAKSRKFDSVPPELRKFYEDAVPTLLRYATEATKDIQKARLFGPQAVQKTTGGKDFLDIDGSISAMINHYGIVGEQAKAVRSMLRSRFEGGEKGMPSGLAGLRNVTNAGLLGNFWSTATQVGDILASFRHQGIAPTFEAIYRKATGKQIVSSKDLGLVNHLAEELSELGLSGKLVHESLKYSSFKAVDLFAKDINLNAALVKNRRLLSTPKGVKAFSEKYGPAFGEHLPAAIADIRAGAKTRFTEELAFNELSDIQPISKLELPQAYLDHPNGRLLYQMKTYMVKQGDSVRREAYDEIASGDPKRIAKGFKNLATLGTLYAVSNVPGDVIRNYLSGRDEDVFSTPALVENVLGTFGISRYAADRLAGGKAVDALVGFATPPLKVIENVAYGRPEAVANIPLIGRGIYDRALGGNEKREIAANIRHNKEVPENQRKRLSPEAKRYLERKRREREREERRGR